ncbi:transcriptional regulator [Hahella sp. CCB-MM4]|uniref:LysR family transcriptional regulator n=1 Tax=Hahella sp. (strain CCB-MM4) TaxID=1926491 RepID=UPI000B9B45A6|nr:LysR family transcriptional regulator [Hahella sp. CCB-MM4]OZG73207.1 transcriptional regulator [Hahella sp. CCB-MM4]
MYLSHHLIGHLPFLAAVARCQSFTLAAESMHVSQAAVSYQIRQLEQKLGLLLVVRQSGSRIHLTSAGQTLVEEYLDCEKRLQLTLENLGSEEPKGTLHMTVPVDFGSAIMPAVMARLANTAPQLEVNLHVSDEMVDMVANQFDLAVRSQPGATGLEYQPLVRSRKQLVASQAYLDRYGIPGSIEELSHHRLLVRGTQTSFSWQQMLGQVGLSEKDIPNKSSLGNTFALAEGVRQGLGLAILPRFILVSELQRGEVVPLLEEFSQPLITDFFLVHLSAPQIGRFANLITTALQEVIHTSQFKGCFVLD